MRKRNPTAQDYKNAWTNPLSLTVLGYYFSMAIVGLLTPDNILSDYPWAREFSDFMAALVPQIDRITALNIQPDVNRFYFSVLWAGSPLLLVILLLGVANERKKNYPMWKMPLLKSLIYMAGFVTVIYFAQTMYGMTDVSNRQLKFMLGNVLGRSFWASVVFVYGSIMSFSIILVWAFAWLTGYIPRNIGNPKIKRGNNG